MAMQAHQIHIIEARERVLEVRDELFAFGDVLDVFATGRPDVLVVICSGRPRPAEWLGALRDAGYQIPVRAHARAAPSNGTTTSRSILVHDA